MDETYGQNSSPTSHSAVLKTKHSELDDVQRFAPVREVYLRKTMMESSTKQPPKSDRDIGHYEAYLRDKWPCTEAMPEPFDPFKLEAVLKSRFPSKRIHGESSETYSRPIPHGSDDDSQNKPSECDVPYDPLPGPANEPPDTDEQLEDREIGVSADNLDLLIDDITLAWLQSNSSVDQTKPKTSERASTPRIGVGSKPPLSRSAFKAGGQAKTPEYFPFQSRKRRQSRSK
ncbi:hypothetical protein F4803DRAFT_555619 [Xylaria telfairii]|nr:hypothetical protein F4803DRAFT_555619 [Xylaria telfairii]